MNQEPRTKNQEPSRAQRRTTKGSNQESRVKQSAAVANGLGISYLTDIVKKEVKKQIIPLSYRTPSFYPYSPQKKPPRISERHYT